VRELQTSPNESDRLRSLELGRFVREHRRRRGLSQAALARAAGVSESRVQQLELGGVRFLLEPGHLRAMARALELPVSELLAVAGYCEPGPDRVGGDAA
jgi:transcriptional regulator with XRE-family HTH domain